jgi:hypothetical protein
LIAACVVALMLVGTQPQETIAAIEVHGNTITPDAELKRLSGLEVGAAFGPATIDETASRLKATKKFERVQVLKRYASIADPSQILIVIIVDEGSVTIRTTDDPDHPAQVVRNHNIKLQFMPILSYEDGYGLAYGVQVTRRDPLGKNSRLSFPLTWGGDKSAAAEVDKIFGSVAVGRVLGGVSFSRRENPFFHQDDDRSRVWVRGERDLLPRLRAGTTFAFEHDSFFQTTTSFPQIGADIQFDTRVDPVLPRNAVFARAAWDHFAFSPSGADAYGANRIELDGRGYIGLWRQNVLALRAYKTDSDAALPPFLKPILGGYSNLRGFEPGTAIGDTLVSTSAEVIVPLTSPLSFGRLGVSAFIDAAAIYSKESTLADQTWRQGIGAGVWFSAAFFRLNVDVAHGRGASTHVHVGATVSF